MSLQDKLAELDALWKVQKHEESYKILAELLATPENQVAEVYWRKARTCRFMAVIHVNDKEKTSAFTYEAFESAKLGLDKDKDNSECNKWYGILLELTARLEGTKKRIENSFLVKEYLLKSYEKNPKDAPCLHSLGAWCFEVSDLPWLQRKVASALFATPPTSTYEEGLAYFLKAEEVEPGFYSMNFLYLGKTYQRLSQKDKAREYLQKVVDFAGDNNEDKAAKKEAADLLKKL